MTTNFADLLTQPLPDPIGRQHYRLPNLGSALRTSVVDIHDWGGSLLRRDGEANETIVDGPHGLRIDFQLTGSARNKVIVSNCANLGGRIGVTGSDNVIILCGESPWTSSININHCGNGSVVFVGRGSTFVGLDVFSTGNEISVIIGEDCMFSHATMVRTYDQHTIFDTITKDWLNKPQSVLIEQHVWLAQETLVLKNARIGAGSIIGARSTVNSKVEPCSLCVGTPAKVTRSNVSWIRDLYPNDASMAAVYETCV